MVRREYKLDQPGRWEFYLQERKRTPDLGKNEGSKSPRAVPYERGRKWNKEVMKELEASEMGRVLGEVLGKVVIEG